MTSGTAMNGYRSRRAAVRALVAQGVVRPRLIADRLGISLQAANSTLQAERTSPSARIDLPKDLRDRAVAMARKRGLTWPQLALRILTTVIEDDIVAAVLDDAADAAPMNGGARK